MNAELIAVGTELLLGEILNTDTQYLAGKLSEIGVDVYRQTVVGDNRERLKDAVCQAMERADVVIASGGLGPTPDDLTKEVMAECAGEQLKLHQESLERMQEYFRQIKGEMTENNIKQAMMPEHGIVLPNHNGTAPGCIIEVNGKSLIMLPGPPNELTLMYEESVEPYLRERTGQPLYTKTFRLVGIGESKVSYLLADMMAHNANPTVAPYAKTGECHIRLAAKANSPEEAEKIMRPAEEKLREVAGEFIYSEKDESLPEVLVKTLAQKGMRISFAESCTGGMAAKMITDISGASAVLEESYVTYSNHAKHKLLGVREETLKQYGAVSSQTAHEMAVGVSKASEAQIGVGITGIAGPDGGTPEKPVGLVYAAVCMDGQVYPLELHLNGTRDKIRYNVCIKVFAEVLKRLKERG